MDKILGIVNFESDEVNIAGLSDYRTINTISFMGRYRLIDFVLSNMSNSGIENIQVYTKKSSRSIFEHIGRGSQYNINPKRGKLSILPADSHYSNDVYNHDIGCFTQYLKMIKDSPMSYVVIAPSYFVYNIDFAQVLKHHMEEKNDITMIYKNSDSAKNYYLGCDTLIFDETGRVEKIEKNLGKFKKRNISLEAYVMSKNYFVELIEKASEMSELYTLRDIIEDQFTVAKVCGYSLKSEVCCINSLSAYLRTSLDLKNAENISVIFKNNWPILTRTSDSAPTHYTESAYVKSSLISNGCYIEGEVENCVIGRNVVVKKGAVVKNCVLLADSYIGENAKLENVIVDKEAIVNHVKKLNGQIDAPLYVKKFGRI